MKTLLLSLSVSLLFTASCDGQKSGKRRDDSQFKKGLVPQRIGQSPYYISIPRNYKITTSQGVDFDVYYFSPKDTTTKAPFSGGLYFGNFPSLVPPDSTTCKQKSLNSEIMGEQQSWTTFLCGNKYSLQIIVDSKSKDGWNQKIHAFGSADSNNGVSKLLEIYSTLIQKNK